MQGENEKFRGFFIRRPAVPAARRGGRCPHPGARIASAEVRGITRNLLWLRLLTQFGHMRYGCVSNADGTLSGVRWLSPIALNPHVGVWGLCPQPLHARQPISGFTARGCRGIRGFSPTTQESPFAGAFASVSEGKRAADFCGARGNAVVNPAIGRFTTRAPARESADRPQTECLCRHYITRVQTQRLRLES